MSREEALQGDRGSPSYLDLPGPVLLESVRSRISRERAYSPLVRAALGDASVELLSPTEAPGARGAAAIARRHVVSPQREGVGER